MNRVELVDVLSALASGVHPISGEAFEEDSPYNHPMIIRALFGSLDLIQAPAGKSPRKSREEINRETGRPLRFNMRWSEEEDGELLHLIEQGTQASEIADQLLRTKGSIHGRLQRQGLLEREELLNRSDEEILDIVQTRLLSRADEVQES